MTEFEFERGEILTNLTLLEDHFSKFDCPYCEEKHLSKIIGYAEEIAAGKEGDEKEMNELAEQMREIRRKIQGAKEHSHEHKHEDNPGCPKLKRCIRKVEKKENCYPPYTGCSVNPVAVCKASVKCP